MTNPTDRPLLDALLDSWDRHHTILLRLLRAVPEGGLDARALDGSPTVGAQFLHVRGTRLFWLSRTAPEFLPERRDLPPEGERDAARLEALLDESARALRDAVRARVEAGRPLDDAYDHPLLLLQHMLWHEGYHVGQIMLALKAVGRPFTDAETGPLIWDVWRSED